MLDLRLLTIGTAAFFPLGIQAQVPTSRPPGPGTPAGATAFVDVNVVPMDHERVLPNQTVLVASGRITALGPSDKISVPTDAMRIDGRGKYLIPGLADMHVHLDYPDSAGAELWLFRQLATGATTIRNMNYRPPVQKAEAEANAAGPAVLRLRARAAAGQLLSPRIYTAGQWSPGPYVSHSAGDSHPEPPLDSIAAYVAAYKAAGFDFIKARTEPSVIFDSVMAAARRVGIPVAGHVPPGVTIEQALASGMRSIEHATRYSRTDTARLREQAEATRRAGVWNTPTLIASRAGPDSSRSRLIKALHDAGARLLLGTDISSRNELPRELELLVQAGLTPYQALLTGTRNPAEYFGTLDSTGTIAVGKRADLVLLRGHPLEDIRNTAQPAGVMIGGRWLSRAEIDRRLASGNAATAPSP